MQNFTAQTINSDLFLLPFFFLNRFFLFYNSEKWFSDAVLQMTWCPVEWQLNILLNQTKFEDTVSKSWVKKAVDVECTDL